MTTSAPPRARRAGATPGTPPVSPVGRRPNRPRWRDGRLLVGLLLVLVSVAVGARVVSAAQQTPRWVAVDADLPAGHVLADGDLVAVGARLDRAVSRRYYRLNSRAALLGRSLIRPVGAGNLLPQDALAYAPVDPTRVVPVVVKAGRLPGLGTGDRVDVYVLARGPRSGQDRETLVTAAAEYLGSEVLGSGDSTVQLRVPVADAIRVVAASQSERVDLVRRDGAENALPPAAPTEIPGFGS